MSNNKSAIISLLSDGEEDVNDANQNPPSSKRLEGIIDLTLSPTLQIENPNGITNQHESTINGQNQSLNFHLDVSSSKNKQNSDTFPAESSTDVGIFVTPKDTELSKIKCDILKPCEGEILNLKSRLDIKRKELKRIHSGADFYQDSDTVNSYNERFHKSQYPIQSSSSNSLRDKNNASNSIQVLDSNISEKQNDLNQALKIENSLHIDSKISPNMNEIYEVRLLIDKREKANSLILRSLHAVLVPCELAVLAIGDFLWVARPTRFAGASCTYEDNKIADLSPIMQETLVLDTVIERKCVADLACSLIDGRYFEQKQRLQSTQINHTIYMVEGETLATPSQQKSITTQHIKTAIQASFLEHNLHVIRTRNMDHTIAMLQHIHAQIEQRYKYLTNPLSSVDKRSKDRFLRLCNFQSAFVKRGAETIKMQFAHQLRQIHGCSVGVALAIVKRFGCLREFCEYFLKKDKRSAELELQDLSKEGELGGRIGPKLAKRILKFYFSKY